MPSALVEPYLTHKGATIDPKHLRDTRMRLGVFLKTAGDKDPALYPAGYARFRAGCSADPLQVLAEIQDQRLVRRGALTWISKR